MNLLFILSFFSFYDYEKLNVIFDRFITSLCQLNYSHAIVAIALAFMKL